VATAEGSTYRPAHDAIAVAVLAVVCTAQWAPLLFSSQTFYLRDLFFFQPLMLEVAGQLASGQLPIWNAHAGPVTCRWLRRDFRSWSGLTCWVESIRHARRARWPRGAPPTSFPSPSERWS